MPSYLIVHCSTHGVRLDVFAQPPVIDVSGSQALLDWGDVTLEVEPGDHRVAVAVDIAGGGREGAVLTVRVLPNTGTRISFAPPQTPGQASMLRVDGQWPADAAMAYYAARSNRVLQPTGRQQAPAQQQPVQQQPIQQQPMQQAPVQQQPQQQPFQPQQPAPQQPAAQQPFQPQPTGPQPSFAPQGTGPVEPIQQQPVQQLPPQQQQQPPTAFGQARAPQPTVPAVGPGIGSSAAVPPVAPSTQSAPSFGQVQGAVVVPGQHGQPAQVTKDAYGRDRVAGDKSAPAIPTPHEFHRYSVAESERRAQQQPTQQQPMQQQPPQPQQQGWYPDPFRRSDLRWFDGGRWTPSVMRGGRQEIDPV